MESLLDKQGWLYKHNIVVHDVVVVERFNIEFFFPQKRILLFVIRLQEYC